MKMNEKNEKHLLPGEKRIVITAMYKTRMWDVELNMTREKESCQTLS